MGSRGEREFVKFPRMGATIYDRMMRSKATSRQITEIAEFLASQIDTGRLLDVGTGPGRLLKEIHRINPSIELFGLDISAAMVDQATKNLQGIDASLHISPIQESVFEEDFFDVVTCTGSFYLWDEPEKGLNEIRRILKHGKTAYLFESYSDYDEELLQTRMKENLESESFFRKRLMPRFLMRQLEMTYSRDEVAKVLSMSIFADDYQIHEIELANLRVWLRIELYKP